MESVVRGILGLTILVFVLFLLSQRRKSISWKLISTAILMQFLFAVAILKIPFVAGIFETLSGFFVIVLGFTKQGTSFVFGNLINVDNIGFIFAFQILPTIIFFSALTSLFFYLGILQRIVFAMSWLLSKFLKISGAENLSATANIFLGQTEAPLLIKPYLEKMTKSEILCVMIGGMASSAGGVLAAYVGFLGEGNPEQQLFFAKHLLAASVMAAPATIAVSKLLMPQDEEVSEAIQISEERFGTNIIEAVSIGTEDGLKLAFNVGSMLIVFIAMIAMLNYALTDIIGHYTGLNSVIQNLTDNQYQGFSLQFVLGYIFSPVVWLLGIAKADMVHIGQLLGEKIVLNEFVAYMSLGKMKTQGLLEDPKSIVMATYILSGFANISSIGIQVGGIGSLAPSRKGQLAQLGFKALIGGMICSLMTATIVGMLT
jgi:CNT family concentrative nucleoside transporter